MNRQQRRQGVTQEYINRVQSHTIRQCVDAIYLSIALILNDKYNWPKEDIELFITRIESTFNSIDRDYLSLEDMKNVVMNELNINLGGKR